MSPHLAGSPIQAKSKKTLSIQISSLVMVCFALAIQSFASGVRDLPPKYRDWLQKDVAYIITDEEKGAFLNLASEADRDQFINRFWEIRNPNPGAPTNSYKEEHYRRLEYATQYFGHEAHGEGWRTIRGRIYITLGEPKQKAVYQSLQNVRPMEIWFYSNAHPALPPFFYIVFYKREEVGDFQLYSPYFDGPEKLVTTIRTINDRAGSLRIIDQSAGREVARTTLSLIPDEPVDLANAQPSLQSDVMLSTIRGLANHPFTKEELNNRRQILETVTHRVILGADSLNALTLPLRDRDGNINLHYVIRVRRPQDFAVAENKGANAKTGPFYVSMLVTTRVYGADNKLIFEQERPVSQYLDEQQMTRMKSRVLGYAGILPLPPGTYRIEFLLANNVTHTTYRTEQPVVVPAPESKMTIAGIVPFTEAESNPNASSSKSVPFSIGGVRFTPVAAPVVELPMGQDLKVFYQIWSPKAERGPGKKLIVDYGYGRPGMRGDAKTIQDEVIAEQFDSSGSLLNGKKIPSSDLSPGNYRLSVSITDPDTQVKTFSAIAFRIVAGEGSPAGWDIYDDHADEAIKSGTADYQRALCYLAAGDKANALDWLQRSFGKGPTEHARAKLVEIHFGREEFSQVADLYRHLPITNQTDEQTLLRMAASLDKLGKTQAAIEALEASLRLKEPSAPLYLTLASYYQHLGNSAKAREMEVKAKLLLPKANTPPI